MSYSSRTAKWRGKY